MTPLTGLRVLVTRPAHQARPWCEQLAEAGAEPVAVPLLALVPVTDPAGVRAIKNCVMDFDLYQKAIFVSQNAVAQGMEWLEDYWPQLPLGIDYFAVGEATAQALRDRGLQVQAPGPGSAMNSEALLQSQALQEAQVAQQRILIFRGLGGRPYLGEVLSERGARVDYCELYRRLLPQEAENQLKAAFADPQVWDREQVVALHSGESLHNYKTLLDQLASQPRDQPLARKLEELTVLVPGERIERLAHDLGFQRVLSAENATDASMLAALTSDQSGH